MTRRDIVFYTFCLVLMGAGWGSTQPMSKIAVSSGYGQFGLVFWQMVIGAVLMGGICTVRGSALIVSRPAIRLYVTLALIGTIIPNSLSYQAAVHLPAGIMSLLISMIPMFAFVIALVIGNDTFAWRRFVGLLFGLAGVLMIIAPSVDLGQNVPIFWAGVYLLTALFYALEGNYIAKWGTEGLGPFQVMFGASLVGAILMLPVVMFSGQYIPPVWPLPAQQLALLGSSVIHAFVYATYVWLAVRAGAVFTAQVSYLVTGFGLIWAWIMLGEGYASSIWLALGTIFVGMYLVQPRPKLAQSPTMGDT